MIDLGGEYARRRRPWPRRSRRSPSRRRNRAPSGRRRSRDDRADSGRAPARRPRRTPRRAAAHRCAPRLSSVACQIGVISVARWRRISGTSGGAAIAVLRSTKSAGSTGSGIRRNGRRRCRRTSASRRSVRAEFGEAIGRVVGVDPSRLPRELQPPTPASPTRTATPSPAAMPAAAHSSSAAA